MQNTTSDTRSATAARYRERLSPSLWMFVGAAAVAPMAALVLVPFGTVLPLVVGLGVGVLLIVTLVAASPVVEVSARTFRAGRAHIPVEMLGEPVALTGSEARSARGPGLGARDWHLLRGGIDGVLIVPVIDPDDPTPAWVVSSRTPERLAAAIERSKATLRSPSK